MVGPPLGTGKYLLGIWDRCILNFQCEKSRCPIEKTNKNYYMYSIIAEVEKSSSSMIILAKKSMCLIAFCTSPNPPTIIDQSLNAN